MRVDDKLKMLNSEIDHHVQRLSRSREYDKFMGFWLKMFSVILGAAITALLGLEGAEGVGLQEVHIKNLALLLAAFITVINAYAAFYDFRSLWIRRTVTLSRLRNLKRDVSFYEAGTDPEEIELTALVAYKDQLNKIMDEDLDEWLRLRGAGEGQTGTKV